MKNWDELTNDYFFLIKNFVRNLDRFAFDSENFKFAAAHDKLSWEKKIAKQAWQPVQQDRDFCLT